RVRAVHRTGQTHHQRSGRLRLQRQIGQHVAHQWLVHELFPERLTVLCVVQRVRDGGAHARRRTDDTIQPGAVDHLDDGAHPTPRFTDHVRHRVVVLQLGGGVGPVAELVLQTLDVQGVTAAVVQDPRYQETTEPLRCLGQGEEEIAHRSRGEPLVPGDAVKAFTCGYRTRGVGAHVRTALLLGHRHPGDEPTFGQGCTQPEVV